MKTQDAIDANKLWIDTRLNQEEMDFLNQVISEENKPDWRHRLVGNISKSELLKDKDNWFYETVLEPLTEKMFYREENNYYKYHIEKEEPLLPKFELETLWINYQKKHEFNPIHNHNGDYSFVIFMKIPTHWKEQQALPISANSIAPFASDFQFVGSMEKGKDCFTKNFRLSSEDEGRMLFFPSWLQHQVYPFYECEEERVTISGNILLKDPNRSFDLKVPSDVYEEKEKMLKILENSIKVTKEELEMMKMKKDDGK